VLSRTVREVIRSRMFVQGGHWRFAGLGSPAEAGGGAITAKVAGAVGTDPITESFDGRFLRLVSESLARPGCSAQIAHGAFL